MMTSSRIKKLGLSFTLSIFTSLTFSQDNSLEALVSDFNFLINKYVTPAAEGIVYQTSSAWNTDAKALNLWEVKLSVQGNFLLVPNKKRSFFVNNSQLDNLFIVGADSGNIPTAVGGENTVLIGGNLNDDTFEFEPPSGIDQNGVFHPQVQAALGLPYGTSFMVRVTPNISIGSSNIEAFGFGLTHNISQWIPKIKASTFDIATTLTYSSYNIDYEFSELELVEDSGFVDAISGKGSTISASLISSKQLGNFDASFAMNYSHSSPDISFDGEGALLSILNPIIESNDYTVNNFTVDFGLNYNYKSFSINSIFTVGDFRNLLIGINYTIKHKSNIKE